MSRGLWSDPGPSPQKPRREEEERLYELDEPLQGNPNDPKWDREEPEKRIRDEGHDRQRPADDEEEEPEQKLHHLVS